MPEVAKDEKGPANVISPCRRSSPASQRIDDLKPFEISLVAGDDHAAIRFGDGSDDGIQAPAKAGCSG